MIKVPQRTEAVRNALWAILFGLLLNGTSAAVAGQRGSLEGEPKKSYGAIDVVMYQTSW